MARVVEAAGAAEETEGGGNARVHGGGAPGSLVGEETEATGMGG